MYLLILFKSFFLLLIYQLIFFKILKIIKLWHMQLFIFFALCVLLQFNINFLNDYLFLINYIIFFLTFIISYLIFLTLIFNESPSIFILNNSKKKFLTKKFIKDRTNKLIEQKLIKNKKLTKKGSLVLKTTIALSEILFSEKI
jgi:hypothetical protein